jgi:hypothetical protein
MSDEPQDEPQDHILPDPFEQCDKYRGVDNLKSGTQEANISPEEFTKYAREIVRCANDIDYFANTYYTIISLKDGKTVIHTYPRQTELIQAMVDENRLVVLASRQTGKCICGDTLITVRNKHTLHIETLAIIDFFERFT